jgi:predicted nuclease of predicted toxin-antitoxin system
MRVLVDENMPWMVVVELRRAGHEVLSAMESMPAEPDEAILERARVESRLVITQDKDFGQLAFHARLPADCGIILFRLDGEDPESDRRRVLETLQCRQDWRGCFAVVTGDRTRIRPLPSQDASR